MKTKIKANKIVYILLAVLMVMNCMLTACGDVVTIHMQISDDTIAKGQTVSVLAMASNGEECKLSVTNPELVVLNGNNLTVIAEPETDTKVTVTASLASDPDTKTTKEITVKAAVPVAPTVEIFASTTELTMANFARLTVTVSDGSAYNVRVSHANLVHYFDGVVSVVEEPETDTVVTVTVTTTGKVPAIKTLDLTVKAKAQKPNIVVTTRATELSEQNNEALINVAAPQGLDYTLAVTKGEQYVTLDQQTNTITWNAENLAVDTYITVTATLDSDSTVTSSCNLVIRAKRIAGKVIGSNGIELTQEKIDAIGNESITVNGTLSDCYTNLNTQMTDITTYDMSVQMSNGAWRGEWNVANSLGNAQVDNYRKGTSTGAKDALGNDYHYWNRAYINKDNEVAYKPVTTYQSQPIYWEEQHLWNHLGDLPLGKIVNAEAELAFDLTKYGYTSNDGLAVFLYKANENTTTDEYFFLTYLSYCLTPMLADTLDSVYLVVDKDGIVGLIGRTEIDFSYGASEIDEEGWDASDDQKPVASYYTEFSIRFSEIGTTVVANPEKYTTTPDDLLGDKPYDALTSALANMKGSTNYTFLAEEISTYAPSTDADDYVVGSSQGNNTLKMLRRRVNPAASTHTASGKVGTLGYVTSDAVLLAKTGKYDYSMDNLLYFTNFSGYKQFNGWYEEFAYDTTVGALHGTKRVDNASILDIIPQFNFAPEIFEFTGNTKVQGIGNVFSFKIRDDSIAREVAMELSMDGNARNATSSVQYSFTLEVACDIIDSKIANARLIKAVYPYSYGAGSFGGYIEVTYDKVGTTVLDAPGSQFEGLFDGYVNRQIMSDWSMYTVNDFYYLHSNNHTKNYGCYDDSDPDHLQWHCTNPDGSYREGSHVASGETMFKFIYGETEYAKMPQASAFLAVFGDNISGPFFNSKESTRHESGWADYASITARTTEYDENSMVTNYEEICEKFKTELGKLGFAVSQANTDLKGKIPGQSSRYLTMISENGTGNIEIVLENNYTKNFWVYFYVTGDWTLSK